MDTVIWLIIIMITICNSLLDIEVIHGRYDIGPKHKLNIVIHQFYILTGLIGIFFMQRANVIAHLFLVSMFITCWLFFRGCVLAQWQRANITYSQDDFLRIQKSKRRRLIEFVGMVVPMVLIDIYKLRVLV